MSGLRVLNGGILALVQDLGRFGYQHLGLSTGGAADEHAYLWANRLLGNVSGAAAVEICFGGLQLEAEISTRIAMTGADLQPTLNGEPVAGWQTLELQRGDRLAFGYAKQGIRGYLAVQGGFQIEPVFGSVSTVMREQVGGLDGKGGKLQAGDLLPCVAADTGRHFSLAPRYRPDYSQPLTLHVIEGHQRELFPAAELARFYSETYRISPQSDRMGVRLERPRTAAAGRWHYLGRNQFRCRAGAQRWPADHTAQGPPNHRRLPQTGHGIRAGCFQAGPASAAQRSALCAHASA